MSAPAATSRRRRLTGFLLLHVLTIVGVIFIPLDTPALLLALALYVVRMWGVTAGHHRYFAHRSYRVGRPMQLALAFVAMSSSQRGVLWWAAHHRRHHKHADTEHDPHSPRHQGFWQAHLGWVFDDDNHGTDHRIVADLAKFPELVWLDRHWWFPPAVTAVACTLALGVQGFMAFCLSTMVLWHATFLVNSLCHTHGTRRYETDDTSRNNALVALLTLGEGWHNNHHHCQSSARAGLAAYELDPTWYSLLLLERLRLVRDLRVVDRATGRLRTRGR